MCSFQSRRQVDSHGRTAFELLDTGMNQFNGLLGPESLPGEKDLIVLRVVPAVPR